MPAKKIKASAPGNRNVFINCPFDPGYKKLLDAIVFAVHDCGFVARSALEDSDSGPNRLEKILDIIEACRHGIHDISRVELGTGTGLPRFNMPFECGLFWGARRFGGKRQADKRLLILDSEPHRYRGSLSDVAGQDIGAHANDSAKIIGLVRNWLSHASPKPLPGAAHINGRYQAWKDDLPALAKAAGLTLAELEQLDYFGDYVRLLVAWIREQERKAAAGG